MNSETKGKGKTMNSIRCYGQVSGNSWTQEHYESSSRDAGRRTKALRAVGFNAHTIPMGLQLTSVGAIRMTMVDIRYSANQDSSMLPQVDLERL